MAALHGLIGALAFGPFLAGCAEVTGPRIEGRWAAPAIELLAQPASTELRLACAAPARLTYGVQPDSTGTVRFSTPVQPLWGPPYRADFVGQLLGEWLFATVTRTFAAGTPVVQRYSLRRDGDPEFDRIFCAL